MTARLDKSSMMKWAVRLSVPCAAVVVFLRPAMARAACTGSGTAWSCPAGATTDDIQSALGSASDGATITFANGSYTATGWAKMSNAKGVTLICATVGGCTVTGANRNVFGSDTFGGTNAHLYRVSGFVFDMGNSGPGSQGVITFDNYNGTSPVLMTQIRVDHNSAINVGAGTDFVFLGHNTADGNFYGVIDHNTLAGSAGQAAIVFAMGGFASSPPDSQLGTANNMFVEDNTLTFTQVGNASALGCSDAWGSAAALVLRHNTSTNCLWTTHGATHAGGPSNVELYDNDIRMDQGSVSADTQDCYRCFHHQGSGEFIAFDNKFTAYSGKAGNPISMSDYRSYGDTAGTLTGVTVSGATTTYAGAISAPFTGWGKFEGFMNAGNNVPMLVSSSSATDLVGTTLMQVSETHAGMGYAASIDHGAPICDGTSTTAPWADGNRSPASTYHGYPCAFQPGRDFHGKLMPMYAWNNYWSDTLAVAPLSVEHFGGHALDYFSSHLQADRDWYSAVSPSAQTSPTSPFDGTTGMGFGTLANRPTTCTTNALESGGGVGYFATDQCPPALYQCTATNTWSPWYSPYTYPHPLQMLSDGGTGDGGGCSGGSGTPDGGGVADGGVAEGGVANEGSDGPSGADATGSDDGGGGVADQPGSGVAGTSGGCGCRAATRGDEGARVLWGVGLLGLVASRRRRRV